MPANRKLSGVWRGRLVDIQGFEGEVQLTLQSEDDGQVHGTFVVEIGGHHSTLRQRGEVRGKGTEKELTLALASKDRELPVRLRVTGDVLDLRDGGAGLRATYEVSAKGYSPLQGGVFCASRNRKMDDETVTVRDAR